MSGLSGYSGMRRPERDSMEYCAKCKVQVMAECTIAPDYDTWKCPHCGRVLDESFNDDEWGEEE